MLRTSYKYGREDAAAAIRPIRPLRLSRRSKLAQHPHDEEGRAHRRYIMRSAVYIDVQISGSEVALTRPQRPRQPRTNLIDHPCTSTLILC